MANKNKSNKNVPAYGSKKKLVEEANQAGFKKPKIGKHKKIHGVYKDGKKTRTYKSHVPRKKG